MVLVFRAALNSGREWLDIGLRDIAVHTTVSGPVLYAMSGPTGGLGSWRLASGQAASLADVQAFSSAEGRVMGGPLFELGAGLVTGSTSGHLQGYWDGANGTIGGRASWSGLAADTVALAALTEAPGGFVYGADRFGAGLHLYQRTASGNLHRLGHLAGDAPQYRGAVVDLDVVSVGAQAFLLATDLAGRGVSSYWIDPATGGLQARGLMGAGQGLGVMTPVALETAQIGGATYAVLASAGGQSGALSVLQLRPDGQLVPVDHVLDSRVTRFGQPQDLEVISTGTRAYVMAAGGDGGISLLQLLPTGQLVYLQTYVTGHMPGLAWPHALSAVRMGGEIQLFAADVQAGLAQFALSLSQEGVVRQAAAGGAVVNGGGQNDILIGSANADQLRGYGGDDILVDGRGQDVLSGGGGADIYALTFDGQRDVIEGFEPGVDRLDLSAFPLLYDPSQLIYVARRDGAGLIWREDVTVVLSQSGQALTLYDLLGAGFVGPDRPPLSANLLLTGTNGPDQLAGQWGADTLYGQAGTDVLYGDFGTDQLYGGSGADTLEGGEGHDTIWGGFGRDMVYLGAGDDLFWDADQGGDFGRDTVFGGLGRDTLQGGAGNDEFHGKEDADWLWGRLGDDQLYGGSGADTLEGGEGHDTIWGGFGRDMVYLGAGDDLFWDADQGGDFGRDTVFGGLGRDTLQGGAGNDEFHGKEDADWLWGRLGDDQLYGGSGADTLEGGEGHDTIWGGFGRDMVYLGAGDDLFWDADQGGDFGRDTVFGGLGRDTLQGGAGNDEFHGKEDADWLWGRLGDDQLYGGSGADTLEGGEGHDTIWGGFGRDMVYLGAGDDLFWDADQGGDFGRDTVFGGLGRDTLQGGAGNDEFHGKEGADLLLGGRGDDLLFGGAGADRLDGGAGLDRYWGGAGEDRFVFAPDAFADRIMDFSPGQDVIVILGGGVRYADLQINAVGQAVQIRIGAEALWLEGLHPSTLSAADFLFE